MGGTDGGHGPGCEEIVGVVVCYMEVTESGGCGKVGWAWFVGVAVWWEGVALLQH